jgi:phage baseplate assembly protein V
MNNADIERRLENLLRIGTISAVNHQDKLVKVSTGKLVTQWLPWPADIGKNYIRWRPLRLNTQVILACISGDPAQATIIGTLYSNDLTPLSCDPNIDVIAFDDGSFIEHHQGNKTLKLHSAGDFIITAAGSIDITAQGNTQINATRVDIN